MTHCSLGGQVNGEVLLGWFENRRRVIVCWLMQHIRPVSNIVRGQYRIMKYFI